MRKTILKSHANTVFIILRKFELNHSDFEWQEQATKVSSGFTVSVLVHKPTGYSFRFDYDNDGDHWTEYSPGISKSVQSLHHVRNWDNQCDNVLVWADSLKKEIESPDLWRSISQEKKFVETVSLMKNDNSTFNSEEQKNIVKSLDELKRYIVKTYSLSELQLKLLNNQFEYLVDASNRLGRKDWLNILLSVVVTEIVQLSIQSDQARQLLRFVYQIFDWLIRKINYIQLC